MTLTHSSFIFPPPQRNAIGAHSGSYCIYKVRHHQPKNHHTPLPPSLTPTLPSSLPPFFFLDQALAVAAGVLDPYYKPKFENTTPVAKIGPFPQW